MGATQWQFVVTQTKNIKPQTICQRCCQGVKQREDSGMINSVFLKGLLNISSAQVNCTLKKPFLCLSTRFTNVWPSSGQVDQIKLLDQKHRLKEDFEDYFFVNTVFSWVGLMGNPASENTPTSSRLVLLPHFCPIHSLKQLLGCEDSSLKQHSTHRECGGIFVSVFT